MVYQEQVMLIAQKIAGFTLAKQIFFDVLWGKNKIRNASIEN